MLELQTTSRKLQSYYVMNRYYLLLIVLSFSLLNNKIHSQVGNLSISETFEAYRDSLKETPYQWRLPILGSKLRKMGFDLPYPNGIGINFAFSRQDLDVSNLNIRFGEGDYTNVDNLARFSSISSDVTGVTARYDFWLLPFLNFYGVGGRIQSRTTVDLTLPFELRFNVENEGTVLGWGVVVAGGVGPLVMALNYTMAWTWLDSKNLSEPTRTSLLNFQGGYMFRFKNKPEMNLVVLLGSQYLKLSPSSSGTANISNLIGLTNEKKQRASDQLDDWYNELTETERNILEPVYQGVSGWLNDSDPIELDYEFNKRLFYPVSMSVGFNYQLNHRYNFTGIYSFLGSRDQIVLGVGYRFGFKGKNFLHGVTL
jgi:hypothetical protein